MEKFRNDAVIDGELVAFDDKGVSRFQLLQNALRSVANLPTASSTSCSWTARTYAASAGVPARIAEVLLSDLEEAGLIEQDQEGAIIVIAPPESFAAGVRKLVAKLKTFRFEGERRLRLVADYAQSKECRSVFIRRYFGEEHPPRCGTCDRCRAGHVAGHAVEPAHERPPRKPRPRNPRRRHGGQMTRKNTPH